jgi:hypothetical protein
MSQLGRISGPLLKNNLLRSGVDLAFETDLLYLDVNNLRVGINTSSPTHDLTVNGTARTSDLLVTNQLTVGNLTVSGNTITSNQSTLTIVPAAGDPVVYNSKLIVDNLTIQENLISTNASNANLEFRPQGTGRVEIYSNLQVNGDIHATGDISFDAGVGGNISLGTTNTDNVTFNADIASSIIPDILPGNTTGISTHSLGSSTKKWADLWTDNLTATNVTTDGLVVDGINLVLPQGNIIYVAKGGNDSNSGTHQNDPYLTVKHALLQAVSGDVVYIYPGEYTEIFPITVPVGVTVRGSGIRAVKIIPTVGTNDKDAFLLNGESTVEDITVADFFYNLGNNTGYAFRFANPFTVTTRSPYIRNITVLTKGSVTSPSDPLGFDQGDAGRGVLADGSVATIASKEATMLFQSATFIVPNAEGIVLTNGVRIEWLNSFVYFASKGIHTISGTTGFAGAGKTHLRFNGLTGTPVIGNVVRWYDIDGVTVLAEGTIESIDANGYYLTGKASGFVTATSAQSKVVTAQGGAKLSTSVKKYGSASLLLNGTTDYATVPTSIDFAFGTGEFCVEMWVYRTGGTGAIQVLADFRSVNPQIVPVLYLSATNYYPALTVNGATEIIGTTTVPLNTWTHIALAKSGTSTKIFMNGVQQGSTYTDNNNYIQGPLTIGARFDGTTAFYGNIDDIRVSKGTAQYTGTFTAPTTELLRDTYTTLLLHLNGTNNSTTFTDSVILDQDIRISGSGATAQSLEHVDYSDFGAEVRSIGSANVYGTYGVYANGLGNVLYLVSHNFGYIGAGKRSDNDPAYIIQLNEVTQLAGAKVYYTSVDQKGDFRVGDLFYVSQADGTVQFTTANFDISSATGVTFISGADQTVIDGTKIETGNIKISGNTVETLTGNLNLSAASGQININDSVSLTGNLDVSGNVTIGGNITVGDQASDTVAFVAEITSNVIPNVTGAYNIGSQALQWNNIYASRAQIDNTIEIQTNYIKTTVSNADLELIAHGTGKISVPQNNVLLSQDLTVNGNTSLKSTTIVGTVIQTGNITQTGNVIQTGNVTQTGSLTVTGVAQFENIQVNTNFITTTESNSDLELRANGTGKIVVPSNNVDIAQNLTVTGTVSTVNLTTAGTITAATFNASDISIDNNIVTTTTSNSNLELRASGTGKIIVPNNNVQFDQGLTVNGSTSLQATTITGAYTQTGNSTITGDITQTGNYSMSGALTVGGIGQFENIQINTNVIQTTDSNSDLELRASGTGKILVPNNNVEITNNLTVLGTTTTVNFYSTGVISATSFNAGDIFIDNNVITTTVTSSDLELRANGSGRIYIPNNNVQLDQNLTVNGTSSLKGTTIQGAVSITGNTTQTGDINQTGNYVVSGSLTAGGPAQFENIRINTNVIATTESNSDLELRANGSGKILVPNNNVEIAQNLTVTGTTTTVNFNSTGVINAASFDSGNILIENNVVKTTESNSDLELTANGSGNIYVPSNNVVIDNNLTVNTTTNLKNTNIVGTVTQTGNVTHTGNFTETGNFTLNGVLTTNNIAQFENIQVNTNFVTTTESNSNLELRANGAGTVLVPTNNVEVTNNLTVNSTSNLNTVVVTTTATADQFYTSDIKIADNTITTTLSNSNLELRANGTGHIVLEQFDVINNVISTNANADIVLQPNGTGIVNVNSTQSIKIPVGTTGDRPTGLAGMVRFNTTTSHYEGFDGTNWIILDGVYDLDRNTYLTPELTPGANDNTFRFYANNTLIADLNSSRLNAIEVQVDNINVNGTTISTTGTNTDLTLAPNGTGAVRIGNFAISGNNILNVSPGAVTILAASGTGYFKINGNNGFVIPVGDSGARPVNAVTGMTRYNNQAQALEIYDGITWTSAAGVQAAGINAATANDIAAVSALIFG